MTTSNRIGRRRATMLVALGLAPVAAVASLTAVALAQPAPDAGPVPSAAFQFGQQAARELAKAHLWAGEVDAVALSRDATRRDLVHLMQPVLKLPTGAIGQAWRDVAPDDADGGAARYILARGWLPGAAGGTAALDQPLTGSEANRAWTLALGMGAAVKQMARFHDASGRRFTLPPGFATAVTAREAGLHRNYPAADEALERTDAQAIRLADLVLMAARGREIDRSGIPTGVRALERFSIPTVPADAVGIVQRAVSLVGYPYVWGGEATDLNPGADPQAAAGFDCSGFVYWVWHNGDHTMESGLNTPDGRTTYTMNVGAKGVKVPWKKAIAGDLVFFGSSGPKTPDAQASHTSIALGNKWIIHSSGGRAGVSITWLPTYWPAGIQDARDYRMSAAGAPTTTPTTTTPTTTTTAPATPVVPPAPATGAPQTPPPTTTGGVQAPPPTG